MLEDLQGRLCTWSWLFAIPVHNWDLLVDGAFITAGKALAHSVLHGGQGFIGMSPAVVAYIETHDLDKALISTCIEDVPDIDVRETISLILKSTKDQLPNLRIQNPAVVQWSTFKRATDIRLYRRSYFSK